VVAVVALALPGLAAEGRAIDTAPSHFAKVDGTNGLRVHYKSFGRGDTALVFVHGWTCDLTFWRDQVDYFNGKTRIVLVDLPGHGQSDKPMVEYTQDLFAKGIHAALQDAGVKKAVLVGHSMGTPVIRQFYRLYPAETQALVIVDGGLRNPFPNPDAAKARLAVLESSAFQGEIEKAIDGMFVPTTTPEIREFVKSRMTKAPKYVSVGAIRGQTAPGLYNEDKITVPVVAIMA
jgi:pimeloyl-ACP methyl ester carboxylesterase